jgi:hypothetical protein
MQYFRETEDKYERLGHVKGDVISICVYVFVVVLMLSHFS